MLWIAAKREENSSFYLSKKDRSSKFPKAIKRFYVRVLGSLSFSLSFSVQFCFPFSSVFAIFLDDPGILLSSHQSESSL